MTAPVQARHLRRPGTPVGEVRRPALRLETARTAPADAGAGDAPRARRRWLTLPALSFAATLTLLLWGYHFPTEHYLTPQAGLGYGLGILGGSAMLLLLVYPLRKRLRALAFLGTTKRWFQAHMALGVAGPVLVLFHANFSLGATNSNVALACMLVVSGSGLFGRYFYSRIHHGLHGSRASVAELRAHAEKLRWVTAHVEFLPDLVGRIDVEEQAIVARSERVPLMLRPLVSAGSVLFARRRLGRYVDRALRDTRGVADATLRRRRQLQPVARRYIDDRLAATRRVVDFGTFERLFSLWHALHLPLFLMLLIAGVVHVVAVHVY